MSSSIEIKKISIVDLDTDAIVNAANDRLKWGAGVCDAIFRVAGGQVLQKACDAYGHCDTGDAVITPGFKAKSKYIIHAVGPIWHGGESGEREQLKSAYMRSLELLIENQCHSIGFPLISAGIFGYPLNLAWKDALSACAQFLDEHSQVDVQIIFAVLNDEIMKEGQFWLDNGPAADFKKSTGGMNAASAPFTRRTGPQMEKLYVGNQVLDAIFFHKPDEPNGFLSNWYLSPFELDGIQYSSVEQYIMYQKCKVFADEISAAAVMSTNDVAAQQSIGRLSKGYISEVWAGLRQMVAFRALMAKFDQNDDLKQMLLDTGEAWLVECARSDKNWACGVRLNDERRFDTANWDGQNLLGFALMEVRRNLR